MGMGLEATGNLRPGVRRIRRPHPRVMRWPTRPSKSPLAGRAAHRSGPRLVGPAGRQGGAHPRATWSSLLNHGRAAIRRVSSIPRSGRETKGRNLRYLHGVESRRAFVPERASSRCGSREHTGSALAKRARWGPRLLDGVGRVGAASGPPASGQAVLHPGGSGGAAMRRHSRVGRAVSGGGEPGGWKRSGRGRA